MAYRKTLAGEVTTRLRFSNKNGANTRAGSHLAHNLNIFFESTGLTPRGSQGVLPPDGMTAEQSEVFNEILQAYLDDSRSKKEIDEDYNKIIDSILKDVKKEEEIEKYKNVKGSKKKIKEIEKAERVANDARLHKELYSNILKEIWDATSDSKWETTSIYNAMVDSLDELNTGNLEDTEDAYINDVLAKLRSGFY